MSKTNETLLKVYRQMYNKTYSAFYKIGLLKIPFMKNLGRKATQTLYRIFAPNKIILKDLPELGFKMYLDTKDSSISLDILLYNIWEKGTTNIFKKTLKKDMTVLDIGAHTGYYSLLAAKSVGTNGKVYAFEPAEENYTLLVKNSKLNKFDNITAIKAAVTNSDGKDIDLFITTGNTGNFKLWNSNGELQSVKTKSVSIDHYFKSKKDKIDFIIIDIEGAEMSAIEGMDRVLTKNKKIKMIIEFSPAMLKGFGTNPRKLLEKLSSYGFKFSIINESNASLRNVAMDEILGDIKEGTSVNLFLQR